MTKRTRRKIDAALKARIALEALREIRSISDSPRASYYRDQAKRLWEIVTQAKLPNVREQFEVSAQQYELLADSVEREAKRRGGENWL
jgi:hypothetical protein